MTTPAISTEWEELKMVEEYFARSDHYREKLGAKTIVLFQSGSFYEVYGYKGPGDTHIQGSLIEEFSQVCDMQISEKKASYKNKALYMAGFGIRDWQLEKYKTRLLENNYTVVVIVQLDEMQSSGAKKKNRELEGIYSPGTFVPPDTKTQWNNHIMCVWTQSYTNKKNRQTEHILGIAVLNVVTHQSYLLEYTIGDSKLQATSLDDLERCLSIYKPKELILVSQISNLESCFTSLSKIYIHRYDPSMDIIKNAEKQVYCRHIVSQYFGAEALAQCAEFATYELATQSFCVLMHFLEEHNPQLCKRVKLPIWENQTKTVLLANHTLTQLNILGTGSSVHDWLNKCITRMGNRAFLQSLTHPTFDTELLEIEYNTMDQWITQHRETMESLRKTLHQTYDMSSLCWSLNTRKLTPPLLLKLFQTILTTQQIWTCMADMPWMHSYCCSPNYNFTDAALQKCVSFIQSRIILENCNNNNNDQPIIKSGLFPALDQLYANHEIQKTQLHTIWMFLEKQMALETKSTGTNIKYNQSDKHGVSLQMTKLRSETFQKKIASFSNQIVDLGHGITFYWREVTFHHTMQKNTMEIHFPICDELCKSMGEFSTKLEAMTQILYMNILNEIEKEYSETLDLCSHILAKVDVLWTKCVSAIQYNYCRPVIEKDATKAFVHAKGIRHVLIERLLRDELYVPNDICLGKGTPDGILLFGTNAVGKTSLMRALGIVTIMAQAGMYVPCSAFQYYPYRSIYSRILNQDNLFKGLSTFAVEMSELRVIHQYADQNSLILGDELCSGTETTSALCIVMASLIRLHERKASFLLATHFHEITAYPELTTLTRIRCCHMAVSYNESDDCLVYDRILQEGPGTCNYGLEVCKSLYMDKAFMDTAYHIRKTHFPEFEGSLSHPQTKYNAAKIRGKCEKCNKTMGEEIHHMQEQHRADETNGFIDGIFHKNHTANLMSLCESCHLSEHSLTGGDISPMSSSDTKTRRVKTTKGYKIY
jgi:DNA mismatch repair protein MutS